MINYAMNKTELKAEALYQLAIAQKSGVRTVVWDDQKENMFVFYNNGTSTTNNFSELSVQFELNGKFFIVSV